MQHANYLHRLIIWMCNNIEYVLPFNLHLRVLEHTDSRKNHITEGKGRQNDEKHDWDYYRVAQVDKFDDAFLRVSPNLVEEVVDIFCYLIHYLIYFISN